jgi:hypothetical protein
MRRIGILAGVAIMFFIIGMQAQAAMSVWGWWGATRQTIVPISAANPLPVQCL